MASAQLERTTITLRDGTGSHELRATGQVVKFPGFMAVYDESRDQKQDTRRTKAACCPDEQGRHAGEGRRGCHPALHPAAAALF
jgi:DNA topoisomerase-1